jgi:hypothetical protein
MFRAEAFMANTSAWVVGYSTRSLGLLTSIVTSWVSVDGYVCGLRYVCGLDDCFNGGKDLATDRLG